MYAIEILWIFAQNSQKESNLETDNYADSPILQGILLQAVTESLGLIIFMQVDIWRWAQNMQNSFKG